MCGWAYIYFTISTHFNASYDIDGNTRIGSIKGRKLFPILWIIPSAPYPIHKLWSGAISRYVNADVGILDVTMLSVNQSKIKNFAINVLAGDDIIKLSNVSS